MWVGAPGVRLDRRMGTRTHTSRPVTSAPELKAPWPTESQYQRPEGGGKHMVTLCDAEEAEEAVGSDSTHSHCDAEAEEAVG